MEIIFHIRINQNEIVMESNENLLNTDLQVDAASHTHLKEAAMWARFVSIFGIVISVILAIAAFFVGSFLTNLGGNSPYSRYGSDSAAMGAGMITVIYLIAAIICFIMSLYLFRFATKMKAALLSGDQILLNQSFQNLKVYFRIIGIITAIYLVIIVLAILFGLIGVMMQ